MQHDGPIGTEAGDWVTVSPYWVKKIYPAHADHGVYLFAQIGTSGILTCECKCGEMLKASEAQIAAIDKGRR